MSIPQIITLMEICLQNTYFLLMNRPMVQPWVPLLAPLIANLFMEKLKFKAISSAPTPPHLWLRYMDDTFVTQQAEDSHQLLQHINSLDPHIQFTTDDPN